MGQLEKIVGGADDGPLGAHHLEAAQQELAKTACLFDLAEHRLRQLLAQPVGARVPPALILARMASTRVGALAGSAGGVVVVGAPSIAWPRSLP